ncbi:MAG TPA: hypothetical protein VEK08_16570 [Planctomycetota bacterium]|nr:hypothetical protein [Planctomycetota bacterium]
MSADDTEADPSDPYLFLEEHKKELPRATHDLDVDTTELIDLYASSREGATGFKPKARVHKPKIARAPYNARRGDPVPIPDRWRIGMPQNTLRDKGDYKNPYRQNVLKGDYPIAGQDIFVSVTGTSDTVLEAHDIPTPSGVTTERPGSFAFFGTGEQLVLQQNLIVQMELFQGETDFKPRDYELRVTPVFNVNYFDAGEKNVENVDPRKGTDRLDYQLAFQELFLEKHLTDLSDNYDFVALRGGIQFFNVDFRGFLFADNNLGARGFGNYESNRIQYNLAWFGMLNKDTNSGLNTTFESKDENVIIANVIRQDTLIKGYDITGSVAFSSEEKSFEFDQNGRLVRPSPIGSLPQHANKVGYVGFGGNGHIGRLNISHQFYQAFGHDSKNPLAGRETWINAQMAALELSYDMDWLRFRGSYFYASGDSNPTDGRAEGFDAIFDNPNFAGGQFSYWVRQGLPAGNSATLLKSRFSLLPNLSASKDEGQASFVNPGIHLFNIGTDAEILPNLRAVANVNYLQFANTSSLEFLLGQNKIDRALGWDYSLGVIYRPLLNNQIILTGGLAGFTPEAGFRDLYEKNKTLYSGFFGVTLRY